MNKKVLLRERKRHTARHAASTPYVVLSLLTPPAGPDPPGWTWPPPAGPDPPTSWTWPTPPAGPDPPWLDLTPPPLAGPDPPPPLAGPGPPPQRLDLTPPGGWTWPTPPVDRQKDRHVSKHYLPPSFGWGR